MMKKTVLASAICGVLLLNSMTASAARTYQYEKNVTGQTVHDNQVGINPNPGPNDPYDNGRQIIGRGGNRLIAGFLMVVMLR